MTVADRLTIALELSGKRKIDLARHLRVSPSAITQWFNKGTKSYDAANFVRAANYILKYAKKCLHSVVKHA